MKSSICALVLTVLVQQINCRILIIPDERYQPCDGRELAKGEPLELQGLTSDVEYILLDDGRVMLNGSWTFKTRVASPWNVKIIGEKFERGVWTQRLVKNMQDTCKDFFNPFDIFYNNVKTFKRCPLAKGVSIISRISNLKNNNCNFGKQDKWIANELMMDFSLVTMPLSYAGRWRMKVLISFEIDGAKVTDCTYIYGEIDLTN